MRDHFFVMTVFFLSFFLLSQEAPALLQGNRVILVNDYDEPERFNDWKGESGGGEGFQGLCIPGFVTVENAWGKAGASVSLDYEVTAAGSFCYFLTPLVADLTGMSYLSFWMKPESQPEERRFEFVVELHEDTHRDGKFVLGEDTTERIPVSSFAGKAQRGGWRKVVIPLSRFHRLRSWERILEIAFIFENKWRMGKGKLLVDDLLFGSHYPEGLEGREIPMQNRVSSFKIGGRIASPKMKLKRKPISLTLTLTFIDPYLEEIRFEESRDGGKAWRRIQSFYDHSNGGVYEARWQPAPPSSKQGVLLRAVGVNVLGGERELAGPYPIRLD